MNHHKLTINGSGSTGYTAAICASPAGLQPVMFTGLSESDRRSLPGGRLMITTEVENYPGFPEGMTGPELMERLQKQAERFVMVVQMESVGSLAWSQLPFRIQGESTTVLSDSIIIDIGASAEWLNVPGEAECMSRGVSACATCDGPFFKGRDVLVAGGGDASMEEAIHLTKREQTACGLAGWAAICTVHGRGGISMADEPTDITTELFRAAQGAVAIQALWDGDTQGWFVCLDAVFETETGFRYQRLKTLRSGSDLRLFNGEVPPWPEAAAASNVGGALAKRLGVPFHFPAADWPESDCPPWWELGLSTPCSECGIPLLARNGVPWRGVCHRCHVKREIAARESALTPQERASPRCWGCSTPMVDTPSEQGRCASCWSRYREQYEEVSCTDCAMVFALTRNSRDVPTCPQCLIIRLLSRSTAGERRQMVQSPIDLRDPFARRRRLQELVGCSSTQIYPLLSFIYSECNR